MTSFVNEGARIINKHNGENFNIWKFKLQINLVIYKPLGYFRKKLTKLHLE